MLHHEVAYNFLCNFENSFLKFIRNMLGRYIGEVNILANLEAFSTTIFNVLKYKSLCDQSDPPPTRSHYD